MFSKVEVIGYLGNQPQTNLTQDGANVCSFSVASKHTWKRSDGSRGEETTWWQVSAWGRLGEVCQQYLTKGQLIFIEGRLQPNRQTGSPNIWIDQNGQPRASYELRASEMRMLGRNSNGHDNNGNSNGSYSNNQQPRQHTATPQQAHQRLNHQRQRHNTRTAAQPQYAEYPEDDFGPDEIPF